MYFCVSCDVALTTKADIKNHKVQGHEIGFERGGNGEDQAPLTKLSEIAGSIMSDFRFKTFLYDSSEVLYYDDGYYQYGGEALIKTECEKIIPECSKHIVSEVIGTIQRSTACKREKFNIDLSRLVLQNGVLNLDTLTLGGFSPDFLTTIKIPVRYDPKYKTPKKFIQFLKDCLEPHDIITIIEEMSNIFTTNRDNHEVSAMWIGDGSNGKTQALEIITGVFGADNCSHVSIHSMQYDRFASAGMFGKLVNLYGDISNAELNNLGLFKQLVSGEIVSVQKKNKDPFEMRCFAKQFYSANEMPNVKDNSDGFFRRIYVTKWENQFLPGVNQIRNIAAKILLEEKNDIFNLLLENYKTLVRNDGFRYKQNVAEVRDIILKESDKIREFIEECLIKDHNGFLTKDRLYQIYQQYCENKHYEIFSKQRIGANLPSYGFKDHSKKIEGKTYRGWLGFSLNKDSEWNKNNVKGLMEFV